MYSTVLYIQYINFPLPLPTVLWWTTPSQIQISRQWHKSVRTLSERRSRSRPKSVILPLLTVNSERMIFKALLTPITKRHVENKLLLVYPLHLFRIIVDVDRYSEFLPLCSHSQVLRKFANDRVFEAALTVGLAPFFQETYVSRVTINPEDLTVQARSVQSKLFDSLNSQWRIRKIDGEPKNQCLVDFEVEITASDPIIIQALDRVLEQVAGQQVRAFEKRCGELPIPEDLRNWKQ